MRGFQRPTRLLIALTTLLALAAAGCGSPWTDVPVANIGESTEQLGGDIAELTLTDQRVIVLRVTGVAYPYVEGHRIVSDWSTPAKMRVDLREVSKIKVRASEM